MTVRRRSLVGAWFATMALGQVVVYAWAGEKFAWLALHPLIPLTLLAGLGAQAAFDRLRHRRVALTTMAGVGAVLSALTLVVAVPPAITRGADPRELLVTVQTSVDVPPLATRLRAAMDQGAIDSIVVDQSGGGSWPWAWYLHGVDGVAWANVDQGNLPLEADAIIVLAYEYPPEVPPGWQVERFRLREWWVPDYANAGVADLLRWFVARETWSPTASSDQWLLTRRPL